MIISWIIYFAVAIVTGVFFVLYKDLLAFILFLSVLCVPLLLIIELLTAFLLTKIEIEVKESSLGIGKPLKILVKVKNHSPFSVTHIKMTTKCRNLFLNTEHDCKFVISASPFSTKTFTYELNSEHIGNVDFCAKKAVFYDLFSMFSLKKRINVTKIVPIYPQNVPVSSSIRPNNWFMGESEKFSSAKAGDDPSEVFNIREYIDGDKLNKIHWKLTSKTDKYMVKEYSLPVSDNIFIYLDFKVKDTLDESLKLVDSLVKSYMSISLDFAKKGITHYVGWYNQERKMFIKAKIKSPQDVYMTLGRIFSDSVYTDEPKLENCDFFQKSKYSHIILMSSNSAKDVESIFAGFNLSLSLLSVVSVSYEKNQAPSNSNARFITVIPDAEEHCLHGIKF